MGRALSDAGTKTGFQDAITPPWQSNLALTAYLSVPTLLGVAWWLDGFVTAFLVLITIAGATIAWGFLLPRPGTEHYQRMILGSMSRRYANFVKAGDTVRADAMKMLLRRAGIDPDSMRDV
jgi:hypothetical protein